MRMLFSVPLQTIEFQNVEDFCRAWAEGVRVEYKRELVTNHIPKVVSSLANTSGGVWIIGVVTDTNNRPIFPICGFQRTAGIEERITQSCYQNLYPPLLPEIKIIDVPGGGGNVVAVVQILESVEAPHAVENTTKVYVRTNSTTEIIQLAEIDRIEYLLKRRQQPEQKREEMIADMATRCRVSPPSLRVVVGPQYPWRPIFNEEVLRGRLQGVSQRGTYSNLGESIRHVRQGLMSIVLSQSPYGPEYHFEINLYGIISCYVPLCMENRTIRFDRIVNEAGQILQLAKHLLNGISINLLIRARLQNARNLTITDEGMLGDSVEEVIEAEVPRTSEQLNDDLLFSEPIVELVRQLMWSFNVADRTRIQVRTQQILVANRIP